MTKLIYNHHGPAYACTITEDPFFNRLDIKLEKHPKAKPPIDPRDGVRDLENALVAIFDEYIKANYTIGTTYSKEVNYNMIDVNIHKENNTLSIKPKTINEICSEAAKLWTSALSYMDLEGTRVTINVAAHFTKLL